MPDFVCPEGHVDRLDRSIAAFVPDMSRSLARRLIDAGCVFVDGRRCRVASRELRSGARVRVEAREAPRALEPLVTLHADADLVVVDKPAGMPSAPTRRAAAATAAEIVRSQRRASGVAAADVHVVHRLDVPTSGVLVFACNAVAAAALGEQFASGTVDKTYVAVVDAPVAAPEGRIDAPLTSVRGHAHVAPDGRTALTEWRRVGTTTAGTLLAVTPRSGRLHQIRAHLAHAGMPIVGDVAYRGTKADRLHLHAHRIAFVHPVSGLPLVVESPLPAVFQVVPSPEELHGSDP